MTEREALRKCVAAIDDFMLSIRAGADQYHLSKDDRNYCRPVVNGKTYRLAVEAEAAARSALKAKATP